MAGVFVKILVRFCLLAKRYQLVILACEVFVRIMANADWIIFLARQAILHAVVVAWRVSLDISPQLSYHDTTSSTYTLYQPHLAINTFDMEA